MRRGREVTWQYERQLRRGPALTGAGSIGKGPLLDRVDFDHALADWAAKLGAAALMFAISATAMRRARARGRS